MRRVAEALRRRELTRRVGSSVGWSLAGNMAWRALTMVSAILIARLLAAEDFGAYGLINDAIATFGVLASFRLGSTATRYVARYRESDAPRAARVIKLVSLVSLVTSGVAAAALLAAAPWIVSHQFHRPELLTPLMLAAAVMFFRLTGNVLEFTLAGFEAFRTIAGINLIRGLATAALVALGALTAGLTGVFAALGVVAVVAFVLYHCGIAANLHRSEIPACRSWRASWTEHGILWSFALPGVLGGLLEIVAQWQSKILLSQAHGMDAVGVLNVAVQWRALVMFLPGILSRAVLPVIAQTFENDSGGFKRVIQVNLRFIWMLALPVTVLMIVLSPALVRLFGEKYAGSEEIMPWMMSAFFLYCTFISSRCVMDGAGHRWVVLAITALGAAVMLLTTWLALDRWVYAAPAIGMLVGYGLMLTLQLAYLEIAVARGQIARRLGLYTFCVAMLAAACWSRFALAGASGFAVGAVIVALSLAPWGVLLLNIRKGRGISG